MVKRVVTRSQTKKLLQKQSVPPIEIPKEEAITLPQKRLRTRSVTPFPKVSTKKSKKSGEIPVKYKTTQDASSQVTAYMKFGLSHLKLSTTQIQEVPCSIELKASDVNAKRSGIDIVCVIDVSGSMFGKKLELVKKTLLFMVSNLDITDRVSLITFSNTAKILSPLVKMDAKGKAKISKLVKTMKIESSTEIILGLEKSLKVLESRKTINQVTSVLLLTDGIDSQRETAIRRLSEAFAKYDKLIASNYSIYTFGYGADHQADLLDSISQEKNGGFYYVEKEEKISQIFSDCLGEIMSIVADSIFVELMTMPGTIDYSLSKVFSENGDISFRMPPVLAGDKKEAIFLLKFPPRSSPVA